jgi:quercetin dioxygenase-like cupin family protein
MLTEAEKAKEILIQQKINELREKKFGEILIKGAHGQITDVTFSPIEKHHWHVEPEKEIEVDDDMLRNI